MANRYEIIHLMGRDQLGKIFIARDTLLERRVIYRNFEFIMDGKVMAEPSKEFYEFSGRLASLQEPSLGKVYDIIFDNGQPCLITQFLDKPLFSEIVSAGALHQEHVYQFASQMLDALCEVHQAGMVHGILSTNSIRMIPKNTGGFLPMLVDVGLCQIATMIGVDVATLSSSEIKPPEFNIGGQPSIKSDLFMLGQLCYIALAGGHPYAGKPDGECFELYRLDLLPLVNQYAPNTDIRFVNWISDLVSGEAAQRPDSAEEAKQLLSQFTVEPASQNTGTEAKLNVVYFNPFESAYHTSRTPAHCSAPKPRLIFPPV